MTTQQIIIQQDNARLMALVAQLDSALETWVAAGDAWELDPTSEAHAETLAETERQYRELSDELAQYVASLVRTGYRLHLPKGNG